MARTESTMLPLGTKAPDFVLPDVVSQKMISLRDDAVYQATLIMFICNHCPYVKHVNHQLTMLAHDYMPQDVRFLAISANDIIAYPEDAPEEMKNTAQREGYPFPYLFDADQRVARAYHAACTPDFFLFDTTLHLIYRGQLDDSRPSNQIPVDGRSIRDALDQLLAGKPISTPQKPSLGCNIKWKT